MVVVVEVEVKVEGVLAEEDEALEVDEAACKEVDDEIGDIVVGFVLGVDEKEGEGEIDVVNVVVDAVKVIELVDEVLLSSGVKIFN